MPISTASRVSPLNGSSMPNTGMVMSVSHTPLASTAPTIPAR